MRPNRERENGQNYSQPLFAILRKSVLFFLFSADHRGRVYAEALGKEGGVSGDVGEGEVEAWQNSEKYPQMN